MSITAPPLAQLDAFLRFSPEIDAAYEQETRVHRILELRRSIAVGLVVYNVYNFTSVFLLPDILALSVILRLVAVTPVSLFLMWLVGHVDARVREWAITIGMINAFVVPVFLFYLSDSGFAAFTFGELPLSLVFGNMLLMLRFRHAVIFTTATFLLAATAALAKAGLPPDLRMAFVIQIATGAFFSLYANWRGEMIRCRSYIREHDARAAAELASRWSKKFEDLSLTDALTGLPNRRALDNDLAALFEQEKPITIMMIDIDHFKLFNDHNGHPAGDDCLRQIAQCLLDVARDARASVARFGGEEFTMVSQQLSELEAARLAYRIVEAIRALKIPHPARTDGCQVVTASVGIARAESATAVSKESVLARADDALYAAKNRGRNCWSSAGYTAAASAI
jgi:diguanylate cyclase (GGDEF)-like protein